MLRIHKGPRDRVQHMIYNNILETIGNTPVVRLNRMGPDHVELYVKDSR